MAKKKYVSEKEIKIGKKSMWLKKEGMNIAVQDGKKEAFSGTTAEFQAWVKKQK